MSYLVTFFDNNPDLFDIVIVVSTVSFSTFLIIGFYRDLFVKGIKRSIRIAVIGAPRAGKTTLITVALDGIMSGKMAKNIRVNGTKTVARITNHLSILRGGGELSRTEDKDVFAYRYNSTKRNLFYKTQYDIEIADFPGEYSDVMAKDQEQREVLHSGLVGKEFFSWVLNADRYILLIDLSEAINAYKTQGGYDKPLISDEYVARTEALFKNAVLTLKQELLDQSVYDRPVIVVFSKADLLLKRAKKKARFNTEDMDASAVAEGTIQRQETGRSEAEIEKAFFSLLEFLRANFRYVRVLFHSSYLAQTTHSKQTEQLVDFMSP